MTAPEKALEALVGIEHHLRLLALASSVGDVIGTTSAYLGSWTKDRVLNLQKIDGGWGPFDFQGHAEPIHGAADIVRISNNLSRHCVALKLGGIEPTPEILELDLFLAISKQSAEMHVSTRSRLEGATPRASGYSHWSDRQATAA